LAAFHSIRFSYLDFSEEGTFYTMGDADGYLAKPSGACCLKGTIHEGEPRGRLTTISGIETYISTAPEGKVNGNILLYFPDVWGLFNNGLLIMDGFADAGYLVFGLDYFQGVSPLENPLSSRYLF
jgi:hypothetical protein